MATQRYISTSFWDDEWVQTLDPSEKLFYIYLLTNPLTNIAGIYKISDRRISFDTGFNDEVIKTIWRRLSAGNKAVRFKEWVIIPNWPKHQQWEKRQRIREGIENVLKSIPNSILKHAKEIGYIYPIDNIQVPNRYEPSYLNSDSDSDSDLDRDTDKDKKEAPSAAAEPLQPETALYNRIKSIFEKEQPLRLNKDGEKKPGFDNYGKECKAIKELIKKAESRSPENPGDFLEAMIQIFEALRRTDKFYRGQPFLPSALNSSGIWDRVLSEAQSRWEEESQSREFNPITEGIVF